jgi:hypothetical protein
VPRKIKPLILIIDDQDGQTGIKSSLESRALAHVKVLHPNDLQDSDLQASDLVLVDFELDHWPERDNLETPSLKPADGLALAAVLRRQVKDKPSPTAIALYTGKMAELASPLPPENRQHALARLNNLEWVFRKAIPGQESSLAAQLVSLAAAVHELPASWNTPQGGDPFERLGPLLGLSRSGPETDSLFEDVANCLPPLHELSQWSHGLAVLRWFLHRILPYPCFLWDAYRLASRLRLNIADLRAELQPLAPLRKALGHCEYKGILSDFIGPRWWRSRIETFLWTKTKGRSSDVRSVQALIMDASKNRLKTALSPELSVVCIDENYQPLGELCRMQDAVRIRPDDWPAYADQPWTTRRLAAESPTLRALVIREDRARLSGSAA